MKKILRFFGLRRRSTQIKPLELHKGAWHPLFYKAVRFHMMETTAKTGYRF